jgi:hypothetical protein
MLQQEMTTKPTLGETLKATIFTRTGKLADHINMLRMLGNNMIL